MSYHRLFTPKPHDVSNKQKGNGSVKRRGRTKRANDNGISYNSGMGCSRWPNCFTCQFNDCKFGNGTQNKDLSFMANVGDGLKVCHE